MADGERCGDVIGEPWAFEVECQLPAGHEGEHCAEVRWPRYEPAPPSATAVNRYLPKVWTNALLAVLDARPVTGKASVLPAEKTAPPDAGTTPRVPC